MASGRNSTWRGGERVNRPVGLCGRGLGRGAVWGRGRRRKRPGFGNFRLCSSGGSATSGHSKLGEVRGR